MLITGMPVVHAGSTAPAVDTCVSGVHAPWIMKVGLIPTAAFVGCFQAVFKKKEKNKKIWKTTVWNTCELFE